MKSYISTNLIPFIEAKIAYNLHEVGYRVNQADQELTSFQTGGRFSETPPFEPHSCDVIDIRSTINAGSSRRLGYLTVRFDRKE